MKRSTRFALSLACAFSSLCFTAPAQSLVKDLNPGAHPASSNPEQYMKVGNTMFFIARANSSSQYLHQLWKSDGTAANTVMVKDSLVLTNVGDVVKLVADVNGILYFTVSPYSPGPSYDVQMWKSDGTESGTVKFTTITFNTSASGWAPSDYVVMGGKLYFAFGKDHGRELWVTDGTAGGTMEVVDLAPGASGPVQLGGLDTKPMIVYKNKIYFAGTTGTPLGDFELFTSDGTAGGTVLAKDFRPGPNSSSPAAWLIHNNELYFVATGTSGKADLWKTDGTTFTQLTTTVNAGTLREFKSMVYFSASNSLWKSDGTAGGTVSVKDSSCTSFTGGNNDYLFFSAVKPLTTPPYYEYHYWRSDGTTAGTVEVPKTLLDNASFNVYNNKMYMMHLDSGSFTSVGVWESDGTVAGSTRLFTVVGAAQPYLFNNVFYFTNFDSQHGYEFWSYTPSGGPTTGVHAAVANEKVTVYPNPTSGMIWLPAAMHAEVYNITGQKMMEQHNTASLDLSAMPKGIYLLKLYDGSQSHTQRIVVE